MVLEQLCVLFPTLFLIFHCASAEVVAAAAVELATVSVFHRVQLSRNSQSERGWGRSFKLTIHESIHQIKPVSQTDQKATSHVAPHLKISRCLQPEEEENILLHINDL